MGTKRFVGSCALTLAAVASLALQACTSGDSGEKSTSAPAADGGNVGDVVDPSNPEFASPGCTNAACWVVPLPQGNMVRASATTPSGTTFAVGDHGAFLRFDGSGWRAATVQPALSSTSDPVFRNLRAIVALADDDIWVAGEGGQVFRFDGQRLTPNAPGRNLDFVALWAVATDDVWLAAKTGEVFHFDGQGWTESYRGFSEIMGFWASASDDIWLVTKHDSWAALVHFDGAAWNEIPFGGELDSLAVDNFQAISGAERERPWVVAIGTVYIGDSTGHFTSTSPPSAVSLATDLLVTGENEAWAVGTNQAAVHIQGDVYTTVPDVRGAKLGPGPDKKPWAFDVGGKIVWTGDAADSSRSVEPPVPVGAVGDEACAPSGDDFFCLETLPTSGLWRHRGGEAVQAPASMVKEGNASVEAFLRTNEKGAVAWVSPWTTVTVIGPAGERTLPVPSTRLVDLQLLDDGSMIAVDGDCLLFRAAANATSFTKVPGAGPARIDASNPRSHCVLHRPNSETVYSTGAYLDRQERQNLFVRRADGTVLTDLLVPEEWDFDPAATVTASGQVILAPLENGAMKVVRLRDDRFEDLDIPQKTIGPARMGAFGEDAFFAALSEGDNEAGTPLYRIHDGAVSHDVLPIHDIARLDATSRGVLLQSHGAILQVASRP